MLQTENKGRVEGRSTETEEALGLIRTEDPGG